MTVQGLAALKQRVAIVSNKKAAEQYRDSFGDQLSSLFGRSRWALTGLASVTWEQDIRERINELLQTHHGDIYKGQAVCVTSICHCWMLGYSKECALPTVVICCKEPAILRRSMRVVIKHQLLKPRGFDIKGIAPYDLCLLGSEPVPASSPNLRSRPADREISPISSEPVAVPMVSLGQGLPENHSALEAQLVAGNMSRNVCGSELFVQQPYRKATLGGALIINEKFYGLTAGHVLQYAGIATESPGSTFQDAQMYDSDWAEQVSNLSDDESSTDHYVVTEHFKDPEATTCFEPEIGRPNQDKLKFHSDCESPNTSNKADDQVGCVRIGNEANWWTSTETALLVVALPPARSVAFHSSSELDWALIQLDESTCYYNRVENSFVDHHILALNSIKTVPPAGEIILLTSRGNFRAKGGGSFSSLKLPNVQTTLSVWAIDLERNLG
ncbi:MAG: hypothetical protein Q9195_005334 [Heterodermia aff. obscurata]